MAETVKILQNSQVVMVNTRTSKLTGQVYQTQSTLPRVATAQAVFSRPKPRFLDCTGMVVEETWWNQRAYSAEDAYWIYRGSLVYVYSGIPVETITDRSGDGSDSLAKAKAKFGGSEWNLAESLAELNQTANMVANRALQIARFANNLRKGNWKAISQEFGRGVPGSVKRLPASKRIANGWLEVQFGWKPAISDAYNAVSAYNKGLASRGSSITKRSGSSRNRALSTGPNGGLTYDPSKVSSNATFTGVVDNPSVVSLNEMGLLNPALLAWNMMPFSFVVDWFLPISSVLAAMTVNAGMSHSYASITTRSVSVTRLKGYPEYIIRGNMTATRKPGGTSGLSDIRGALLSPNLGLWHLVTSASLARQSWR
jgi:hypothetical protein